MNASAKPPFLVLGDRPGPLSPSLAEAFFFPRGFGKSDDGQAKAGCCRAAAVKEKLVVPDDVLDYIVSFLQIKDLGCVARSCQVGKTIVEQDKLWKIVLETHWGKDTIPDLDKSVTIKPIKEVARDLMVRDSPLSYLSLWESIQNEPFKPYPLPPTIREIIDDSNLLRTSLNEYTFYIDVWHSDGTKVLRTVLNAFPGLLETAPVMAGSTLAAGYHNGLMDVSKMLTVKKGEASYISTEPAPRVTGEAYHAWAQKTFLNTHRSVVPKNPKFSSRICISHRGRIVSLQEILSATISCKEGVVLFLGYKFPVKMIPEECSERFRTNTQVAVTNIGRVTVFDSELSLLFTPKDETRSDYIVESFGFSWTLGAKMTLFPGVYNYTGQFADTEVAKLLYCGLLQVMGEVSTSEED